MTEHPNPEMIEFLKQATKFAKPLTWLVPLLLIPASIAIYVTETQNVAQLVGIIAFALVLFVLLRWAIKMTEKRLKL